MTISLAESLENLELVFSGGNVKNVIGIHEERHSTMEVSLVVDFPGISFGRKLSAFPGNDQKNGRTVTNGKRQISFRLQSKFCDREIGGSGRVKKSGVSDWGRVDYLSARLADLRVLVGEHAAQRLGVDVLRGQARANDVVGCGHALHTVATLQMIFLFEYYFFSYLNAQLTIFNHHKLFLK
jgi:hypothetical protein